MDGATRHRPGFSLVEVLVSIAVLSLLMAILIPALGEGRRSAERARCAAMLSSHWKSVAMYCDASKGVFPTWDWRGRQGPSIEGPIELHNPFLHPSGYGDVPFNWHGVMAQGYFEGDRLHPSLVCPGDRPLREEYERLRAKRAAEGVDDWRGAGYSLAYALFLNPEALAENSYRLDASDFRTQRMDAIRYPSSKGTMKDAPGQHDGEQDLSVHTRLPTWINVAAGDGHVKYRWTDDFRPGVVYDDPRFTPEMWARLGKGMAVDFTRLGVHGRDW